MKIAINNESYLISDNSTFEGDHNMNNIDPVINNIDIHENCFNPNKSLIDEVNNNEEPNEKDEQQLGN